MAEAPRRKVLRIGVVGLRSGNSEILNWIMAAGALEQLELSESIHVPAHRTPAGTGIGLAFCTWRQQGEVI
jgi:hypothetical protein